jgi:pilus assembly protein Flp/PilA
MEGLITFLRDEEGATALEYGLLAALIAGVIIGAVTILGETVRDTFDFIAEKMKEAQPSGD